MYRKAVFAVVYIKGKSIEYVLLKRKLHWKGWEFPKGKIEKNETLLKAVKREVFEETGQIPNKIIRFNISGSYRYNKLLKDRPNYFGQTYKLFAAEIKNKKIKIDKIEHSAYKILPFEKAVKLLTWPNQRKCLRTVDSKLLKKENPNL